MAAILIIEDNASLQRAYTRMLKIHGIHHLMIAETAEIAIAYLKDIQVDAILSDYNLREGSTGGEVIEWIKKTKPELVKKYIFLSDDSKAKKLSEEMGIPYLEKPCPNSTILETIDKAIAC